MRQRSPTRDPITHARLLEVLIYEPQTGFFRWRKHRFIPADTIAGKRDKDGYTIIRVDYQTYRAGRLAWFYCTGSWPQFEIDHRDGQHGNDAWRNLRPATRAQNNWNLPKPSNNTSGFKGVSRTPGGRWKAQIYFENRHHYLGTHDTPEVAHAAYCAAASRLFGEFARPE